MKKIVALILCFVMGLSLAACGNGGQIQDQTSAITGNSTQNENHQNSGSGTPVTLTIGDTVIPATLNDSKAAQDLISRLPYTITLQKYSHDFCAVMSEPLSYDEADQHDGWNNGDIDFVTGSNYFALLFNESKTSSSPHVNLGKMEGDLSFFNNMSGSAEVIISLADSSASVPSNTETKALVVYYSWSGLVYLPFANPQSRGVFLVKSAFFKPLLLQIVPYFAVSLRSNVVNFVVEIRVLQAAFN